MKRKLKCKFMTRKTLIIGVPLVLLIFALYLFFNFDDIYFDYNPKKATLKKRYKANISSTKGPPIINVFLVINLRFDLRFINTPLLKRFLESCNHNIIQIIPVTSTLYLRFYKVICG